MTVPTTKSTTVSTPVSIPVSTTISTTASTATSTLFEEESDNNNQHETNGSVQTNFGRNSPFLENMIRNFNMVNQGQINVNLRLGDGEI